MTIIYLYVKTHNITKKKYLGKTIQDPYKYKGSGLDWVEHCKKYGNDIFTEILLMSESKEEIAKLGRYYSKLWDIVKSEEWLNKIPETCGGWPKSGPRGPYGPQKNPQRKRQPLSKERKNYLSLFWMGKKKGPISNTENMGRKKGSIPWNKGKRGSQVAWNKGLTKDDPRVAKIYKKSLSSPSTFSAPTVDLLSSFTADTIR